MNNLIILTSYYLILLLSIIGFGFFLSKILKFELKTNEIALYGILGIIFLTFISYFTNIFFPHNFTHNLIIHSIGILLFLYYRIAKTFIYKKINYLIIFFLISFFLLHLLSKTHDDFGWYHLPYTLNLSQNKFQFGLGHFNHGFRTPSSLFYLNSIFYLPGIKFYSFNFAQLYIFLFSIVFFYQKIFIDIKKSSLIKFYSLLSLIFILVIFYRLAEHGTDRSGQILLFIIIVFILEILIEKNLNLKKISLVLILFVFVVTLKSYFIIFGLLLIPIIFHINKNLLVYKKIIFSNTVFFSLFFLLLHFSVQLANSGCFFYPINFSCYNGFVWSFPEKEILHLSQWYELWAKSGANPNWRVENPSEYVSNFNWVKNWFSSYFFNKVSDFILGILTILIISFLFIYKKSKKKKEKNKIGFFLLSIIIIFIIWFFKFPQLRYGGYVIIANLFFLPFCHFILKNKINKKVIHSLKILTIIGLVIFAGRNVNRIINEAKIYNYNPIQNAYFRLENIKFKTIILGKDINFNISDGSCWATPQPCTHRRGINATKKYNYIIYF
tara:strand:+ start:185 stop:1846 length:1662 start_codon:yes stop_codon:yes gene_type:complete